MVFTSPLDVITVVLALVLTALIVWYFIGKTATRLEVLKNTFLTIAIFLLTEFLLRWFVGLIVRS